jgi:hypothetical protein
LNLFRTTHPLTPLLVMIWGYAMHLFGVCDVILPSGENEIEQQNHDPRDKYSIEMKQWFYHCVSPTLQEGIANPGVLYSSFVIVMAHASTHSNIVRPEWNLTNISQYYQTQCSNRSDNITSNILHSKVFIVIQMKMPFGFSVGN